MYLQTVKQGSGKIVNLDMDKALYFSFVPGNRVKYIVVAETKYGKHNIVPSNSLEDVVRVIEAMRKRYHTPPLRTLCGPFYKKDKDGNLNEFRSRYSKIDETWEYNIMFSSEGYMIIAEDKNGDEICGISFFRDLSEAIYMMCLLRAQADADFQEFSSETVIEMAKRTARELHAEI